MTAAVRIAFDRRTSFQALLDEAVDLLRAQSPTDPAPKRRSTK